MQLWYHKRGDEQGGPWPSERLVREVAAGRVKPDDLLKSDAIPEWLPAGSVAGLVFPQQVDSPTPPATNASVAEVPITAAQPPAIPTKQPPPILAKTRPGSTPPALPGGRRTAPPQRHSPVVWGYVGATLILLTIGLGVAVVVFRDAPSGGSAVPKPDPTRSSSTKSDASRPVEIINRTTPTPVPTPEPPVTPKSTAPDPLPKPGDSEKPVSVQLVGTKWVNSNGATFVWHPSGEFLHNGIKRKCRDVGPLSLEIDHGVGRLDTLIFSPDLTRFDQHSTTGGDSVFSSGQRETDSKPTTAAPPQATVPAGESVVLRGHRGYVWSIAFSKDGSKLLSVSQEGPVVLWDVATQSQVWSADVPGDLRAAAFHDAGRKVAVQRAGGLVVLDAATGRSESETRFPANGWGKFSLDGTHLALTTANDSKFRLHSVPSGKVIFEHPDRHVTSSRGSVFTRDGSACYAGINHVHRLSLGAKPIATPTRIDTRGMRQTVEAVDVSPDGKRLVTGSGRVWVNNMDTPGDDCVRVWDIASGKAIVTLKGHGGWLWTVCYHPDGKRVLSGGAGRVEPPDFYGHKPRADNSLRLWNVAGQTQVRRFEGHTAAVLDIKCSPDGKSAATGGADGTVRLWQLPE